MDKHKLDALVAPTSGPASLIDLVNGDYGVGGSSSPPAVAGYPDLTVPCGSYLGLPVGMSFFGRAWSEPTLIQHRVRLRAGHEVADAAEVPVDGRADLSGRLPV